MLPNIRLHRFTALVMSLVFCGCLQGFAGDVSLAWDASISAGVTGYKIYYGNSSGNYNTSVNVGNQTSYTVTNIADGIYYFAVIAYDSAANESGYSNEVFTTVPPPDTTPPVLSSIGSSGITTSGATISWTTNESSTTQVEYGLTTAYGSTTTLNTTLQTSHSQTLNGLASGMVYHYRVRSMDAANNLATSGDNTFTTAVPPDTTPPVISSIGSSGITTTAATISWTTNEASTTQVEYGLTTAYGSTTTLNTTLQTSHSQALSGLASGTVYHYRVRSRDAANNLATSGDNTFTTAVPPDTTPPVISSIGSSGITTTAATISWTTNEASTTQVEYGLTTAYGSTTTLNTTLQTSHSQTLNGLASGMVYHYRVRSMDAANNLATSGDNTFTTAVPPDTTPPVISSIGSSGITTSAATISWTTNEASTTQVEYGLTTAYGSTTTLNTMLQTSHSQALSGLASGTVYHYRVRSTDAAANLATSGDNTFTTVAPPQPPQNLRINQ